MKSEIKDSFCIKKGYRSNLDSKSRPFSYHGSESVSSVYQVEVYKFAKKLIKSHSLKSVLDLGCGLGLKLKAFVAPVCNNIVGIDRRKAIEFCQKEHSFGRWYVDDIENSRLKLKKKFELIISADVIEHLVDPDHLLNYIKRHADKDTLIIISTPEREKLARLGAWYRLYLSLKEALSIKKIVYWLKEVMRVKKNIGPPEDKAHVREWSFAEFESYLRGKGFEVIEHFLAEDRERQGWWGSLVQLLMPTKTCQVILCRIKG